MVILKEIMKAMEETKDGCDGNCENCLMYLPSRDECFHSAEKKWQEWNNEQHNKFEQVLKGEQ